MELLCNIKTDLKIIACATLNFWFISDDRLN